MKVFFIILLRMLKTYKYNKAKFYYWWRFRWWRDVWWRDDQIPSRSTAFSCCEMCQILHASPYHYFPSSIMCLLLRFIMVITTKSPRIFCASNNAFPSTLQFMSYVFIQRTFSGFKQLQDCRNYLMQEKV